MTYSICTKVLLATALTDVDEELRQVVEPVLAKIGQLVVGFLSGEVSPTESFRFEEALQDMLRELGCALVGWA